VRHFFNRLLRRDSRRDPIQGWQRHRAVRLPAATPVRVAAAAAVAVGVIVVVALVALGGDAKSPQTVLSAGTAPRSVTIDGWTRRAIYRSPQRDPSYTSWVGAWPMPDGSMMTAFTQATGPVDGRARVSKSVLDRHGFAAIPADRDFSGLDLSAVYLRSRDRGATWSRTRSDSFRALGPHAYSGQATTALRDGTLIRRVNGGDMQGVEDVPATAYIQRLAPGAAAWSAPQLLMDPKRFTYQLTRIQRLRDGRLIATGATPTPPRAHRSMRCRPTGGTG
jgi:hypothetical protein